MGLARAHAPTRAGGTPRQYQRIVKPVEDVVRQVQPRQQLPLEGEARVGAPGRVDAVHQDLLHRLQRVATMELAQLRLNVEEPAAF